MKKFLRITRKFLQINVIVKKKKKKENKHLLQAASVATPCRPQGSPACSQSLSEVVTILLRFGRRGGNIM